VLLASTVRFSGRLMSPRLMLSPNEKRPRHNRLPWPSTSASDSNPASVEESAAAEQQHDDEDDEQGVCVHFLSGVFG
jgi:hypothetical protein